MRPDQHKKKRSAQYKKKHGLKEDEKGTDSGSKGKGARDKPEKREPRRSPTLAPATATGGSGQVQNKDGASGTSHGHGEVEQTSMPSFRRRQVVSNWSRYEGMDMPDEDGGSETLRGADFRQMLSVTTDAMSQFRFRDEQGWEEEGEEMGEEAETLLSVDVDDLAAAMQCLPLHVRLGLDTDIIQHDIVEKFNEEARLNAETYIANYKQIDTHLNMKNKCQLNRDSEAVPISKTSSDKAVPSEAEQDDILDDILNMDNGKSDDINSSKVTEQTKAQDQKVLEKYINENAAGENKDISDIKNITRTNCSEIERLKEVKSEEQEEDLDFLLTLDAPAAVTQSEKKTVVENAKLEKKNVQEIPVEFKPSKTESLEDMLDSLLED